MRDSTANPPMPGLAIWAAPRLATTPAALQAEALNAQGLHWTADWSGVVVHAKGVTPLPAGGMTTGDSAHAAGVQTQQTKEVSPRSGETSASPVTVVRGSRGPAQSTLASTNTVTGKGSRVAPPVDGPFGERVAQTAQQLLGTPYRWGGESRAGFDCSGLVRYTFAQNGVQLARTSYEQYQSGAALQRSQLVPGDLVFFSTDGPGPSHVGVYIGGDRFVNATGRGVRVDSLSDPYWQAHYVGARRYAP
ncbi:MAG: C40 family peptidase [Alicyclobacillus sp.]|nr:C40 family peptidase [Alicyclobacillus sp.]